MRAEEHALALLAAKGVHVQRLIRLDCDSVLFVDRDSQPRTAWVRRLHDGHVVIKIHDGFSVDSPWQPAA